MELYTKEVSAKGKVTYKLFVAPEPRALISDELTPEQITNMVGTVGIMLINSIYETLGPKTFLANRVKSVNQAIFQLYKGTGQKIDDETVEFTRTCWNSTMMALAAGVKP